MVGRGELCARTFVVFCEREWTRQRKQVWDWLMGLGAVPHCWIPGPGARRQVNSGLKRESPKRKLVGSVKPGLVDLYLKSAPAERRTLSKERRCWRRLKGSFSSTLSCCPEQGMSGICMKGRGKTSNVWKLEIWLIVIAQAIPVRERGFCAVF